MMVTKLAFAAVIGALALSATSAGAAQVFATSYSMPNGDGQASGGSFNYWDKGYTGSGSTTTDGAALSGGLGDLTDGVVANALWFNTENAAGTGPYVGWYRPHTADPTITFNFAPGSFIDTIGIHFDNSQYGGVFTPNAILVDGVARAFTGPSPGTNGFAFLSGLNLSGSSHTVQFQQSPGTWTFVSEVTFDGGRGVPEPATWGLMIAGFGAAGAMLRRRRTAFARI